MSSTLSPGWNNSAANAISLAVARRAPAPTAQAHSTDRRMQFNDIDAYVERQTATRYVKVHACFDTSWFQDVEKHPDAIIAAPFTKLLKHDKSTTVALTSFDGRQIVVKRYNPRHPLYATKRLLRTSRAIHCLTASGLFTKAGISVAQTVGIIEKRAGPLVGVSYYLMLYTPGTLLSDWFDGVTNLRDEDEPVVDAIADVFTRLEQHRLFHGDMKSTNLVWQNGRLVILDLDAARPCEDQQRLNQRLASDRARFLKNFATQPTLQAAIKNRLSW